MDERFHYPPDLFNLLVDTIPLLCKGKKDVLLFLEGAGIHQDDLAAMRGKVAADKNSVTKYEIVRDVLQKANARGDRSLAARREVIKRVTEFEEFSMCWESDVYKAKAKVGDIRKMVVVKDSFTRMKQERDSAHEESVARARAEHAAVVERRRKIADVRDRLNALFAMDAEPQKRGKLLEHVLNDLFRAYGIHVREDFKRVDPAGGGVVEQIDGVIELDGHTYLAEMKWLKDPVGVSDLASHMMRLYARSDARGLFISTSEFADAVTFHGQEKSDTNTKLARMNLVVHGLDASNIVQGNTFYDQAEHLVGRCDFVMANPPFNVDGVDTKKAATQVGEGLRLPFGLPGTNAKTGAISNANSLWIQYFYSYLNDTGRAGFVMASSASDAGNKDRDIREQLVKRGHVDVMVAIGNKFFYTRSLPCTLWFFDKGKPEDLRNQVLMIDARTVYHVVSARSHVFTDEQLANLTAVTWLYRGQSEKFVALIGRYHRQVDDWLATLPARIDADSAAVAALLKTLQAFAEGATLPELNEGLDEAAHIAPAALETFRADLAQVMATTEVSNTIADTLKACKRARAAIADTDPASHASQVKLQAMLDPLAAPLKALAKALEARHKQALQALDRAEKTLRARSSAAWDGKAAREARRALLAADAKKNEPVTVRDQVLEGLKQAVYFIHQGHWLHSRFPDGVYDDVPGLCKAVTVDDIVANDWSLTPGRYVGIAASDAVDEEDEFAEKVREIYDELAELNDRAVELAGRVSRNFEDLLT